MTGGDHDAAIELELSDREVETVGGDQPEVNRIHAAIVYTPNETLEQIVRGQTHVPTHGDCSGFEDGG